MDLAQEFIMCDEFLNITEMSEHIYDLFFDDLMFQNKEKFIPNKKTIRNIEFENEFTQLQYEEKLFKD